MFLHKTFNFKHRFLMIHNSNRGTFIIYYEFADMTIFLGYHSCLILQKVRDHRNGHVLKLCPLWDHNINDQKVLPHINQWFLVRWGNETVISVICADISSWNLLEGLQKNGNESDFCSGRVNMLSNDKLHRTNAANFIVSASLSYMVNLNGY